MLKNRLFLSLFAGSAAFLVSASASATTTTHYLHNPIGGGERTSGGVMTLGTPGSFGARTDFTNYMLEFAKFDPTLGSLTSAAFTIYIDVATLLTVTNSATGGNPSGGGNGDVRTKVNLTLKMPNSSFNTSFPGGALLPVFSFAIPTGTTVTSGSLSTSNSPQSDDSGNPIGGYGGPVIVQKMVSDSIDLSALTGSGFTSLTRFTTLTNTVLTSDGGNISASQVTNFDLDGQVVYTYTANVTTTGVPEPMTAAVLLAGIAGLAGIRRRR